MFVVHKRVVRVLVILLGGFRWVQAQQPPAEQSLTNAERVENWKEDLRFFSATLHGTPIPGEKKLPGQKDLAKVYPSLDADLAALEAELPDLRNGVIGWRLARILASAHIAHNSMSPADSQILPLSFEWLDDGPVVTGATAEFKNAIGSRVIKVGSLGSEAFLETISPYLSYETEAWRHSMAAWLMTHRLLLGLAKVVQDDKVEFTLEGAGGSFILAVAFVGPQTRLISLREASDLPALFINSHPDQEFYWRQFLPDSETLYVQYRQCADDPNLKFADFAAQTLAEIDMRKPRRVIVDLRTNLGGNSAILNPLTAGLASRRKDIGVPFVLIGPYTFSSGVLAAKDLRQKAKARLVGGPTGGLQGGYGEAPARKLPHSQLTMQWTISYFPLPAKPVSPDLRVVFTAPDLRVGRDPVLEAAIAAPR
jgi:hypothetical protein